MYFELIAVYRERMQREERNYQGILSETIKRADAEVNKIDRQWNEDEILIDSIVRADERQWQESSDNATSITLSNVINFALIVPKSILLLCSILHIIYSANSCNSTWYLWKL